jgi:hypothetical protein
MENHMKMPKQIGIFGMIGFGILSGLVFGEDVPGIFACTAAAQGGGSFFVRVQYPF